MKIEMKEVLLLTTEEKKTITKTHSLMFDILEQVNDPDIYNAVKQSCDGLEDFEYLVDTEE